MPNIIEADDFDPKRIADEMIKRCLDAREWHIKCYVKEEWFINGVAVSYTHLTLPTKRIV